MVDTVSWRERRHDWKEDHMKEVKFYSMFSVNTFMLTDNAYLSQKQFYLRCLPTAFKFLFCYFSFSSFVSFGDFIIASLINFLSLFI